MRISGGIARGIPLLAPKGDLVRPATDGLRQALFSSIADRVPNACFLDLFAGSGAYGLEALSRGAAGGVFIERNTKALSCLRHNLAAVCRSMNRGLGGLEIRKGDVLRVPLDCTEPSGRGRTADLVFADPPYEIIESIAPRLFERLLETSDQRRMLVAFEMPGDCAFVPAGWTRIKRIGKGARQPTIALFIPG